MGGTDAVLKKIVMVKTVILLTRGFVDVNGCLTTCCAKKCTALFKFLLQQDHVAVSSRRSDLAGSHRCFLYIMHSY